MALAFNLPSQCKIVQATLGAVTTTGGITCGFVSLKNVHKAWIVAHFNQAVGHATGMDPTQATVVAGGDAKAITAVCPIWANENCVTNDILVVATPAITYNPTADVATKLVIFEIDPSGFDVNGGFDVLGFTLDNSAQATNFVSVLYYLWERYPQATPPSAIID